MLRFVGSALILLSAVLFGYGARKGEREHILLLQDGEALIRHARRKVELYGTPLSELFLDFDAGFSAEVQKKLKSVPPAQALQDVIVRLGADGQYLSRFSQEIGQGYKEDTLRLCDECIEMLSEKRRIAQAQCEARGKLYFSLPVLVALSVVLMLL